VPAKFEREVKLPFATPEVARQAVASTGASLVAPRRLQHDCLLDTADQQLLSARSALRVRAEGPRGLLTFKGPQQSSTMKLREEIETGIDDAGVLLAILERIGFRVWFRYEKYREEYAHGDVVIAVDETPIGTFVEIEGSQEGIERVVWALGKGPDAYVLDSYRGLFAQDCERRGVPVTDMLFDRG
jgi:adenylate cyclase class 2